MECHPNPDVAKSDGPNQVPLTHVRALIEQLLAVHKLAKSLPDLELPQQGQCTPYDFKSSESLDATPERAVRRPLKNICKRIQTFK